MSLKNRVELVERGYVSLNFDEMANKEEMSEINTLSVDITQTFAQLYLNMMLLKNISDNTQTQLGIFLKNSKTWYGMASQDGYYRFKNIKQLGLGLVRVNVYQGQQSRS